MIKSTMFAVLACALALPACAVDATEEGKAEPTTGTTHEALPTGTLPNGCPDSYLDYGDGTCLITADPPSTPIPTFGSGVLTPIGGGAGEGAGGGVDLPSSKRAACLARCENAYEACHPLNLLQASACRKTLAACDNQCLTLF